RLLSSARVLEIGSGGNPWFRSNVLCDKYLSDNIERGNKPLVRDREFVQADATSLPFKDKEFDFVLCSHVAEHIDDIAAFFREIQRVGKAGYIETRNYFFEQTVGTATHDWALFVENGKLCAERKWMAGWALWLRSSRCPGADEAHESRGTGSCAPVKKPSCVSARSRPHRPSVFASN
ncbi:MAG: class I SAM-dependent methyltransferase, partial [Terrimicrobiaceae bacterium]